MNNKNFYNLFLSIFLLIGFCLPKVLFAQETVRPIIWVKPDDKAAILAKIENNKWVADYYEAFTKRVQEDVKAYEKDPKAYLSALPYNLTLQKPNQIPPFRVVIDSEKDAATRRNKLQHYLKNGIDCGILYYLTGDEKYAQYSTSVFYTFVKSLLQITPSTEAGNGGWIYQDNHLREAREIGAQIPILYDFIAPYIAKGGKAYNFITDKKEDVSIAEAEQVFKTYINLALEHGIVNCNWPVLESPSLVGNILALNNRKERDDFLVYYLEKNTPHQDALPKVAKVFKDNGNWPESLNYSGGVTGLTTYLMTWLTKFDPALNLGKKYPEVPMALSVPYNLTWPNNNQTIQFGDGHRSFHRGYNDAEFAYLLGKYAQSQQLIAESGSLINTGLAIGEYKRSKLGERSYEAHPYYDEPLKLLWFSASIDGEAKDYPKPTTNGLAFSGISLQRNLSSTNNPKDGLMLFVGGGAFVHGHASGMNMELYGRGHILGAKAGRTSYGTEDHENYYRIFAGHNTVIVNGASRGEGEWANNAINTVKKEAIEPEYYQKPVSANYSFSTTSFLDDKGDKAEATQLRTLGIIRTSPTTGYYIDVYKSKSALPNQYHDYVYHNIGDELTLNPASKDFNLKEDANRYMANAKDKWERNRAYRNPGWHYFKDIQTSGAYANELTAVFSAKSLGKDGVNMKLFISGNTEREYTKVMAPITDEMPKPYDKKTTPTLVIRKNGEAWDKPFAVVFEAFEGNKTVGTIQSVRQLLIKGVFKGFIVNSEVDKKALQQFIIVQDNDDDIFEDKALGIKFKGKYAVITVNQQKNPVSLYVGSGQMLSYQKWEMKSNGLKPSAFFVDINDKEIAINANEKITISNPSNKKITQTKNQ